MTKQGLFVVCDGPSGSGKDKLIAELQMELICREYRCSAISEEALDPYREGILLAKERGKQLAQELVVHRASIYYQHIRPLIAYGSVVLGNRGIPATLAYQTARGEITMDNVWKMHQDANIMVPDLVILTICKPATAMLREETDKQNEDSDRAKREGSKGLSGKVTSESGADPAANLQRRRLIQEQFLKAAEFLVEKGLPVLLLDTDILTVSEEVTRSYTKIMDIWD